MKRLHRLNRLLQEVCIRVCSIAWWSHKLLNPSYNSFLAMPNFKLLIVIKADACGYGSGQLKEGHLVAYFSKTLRPRAKCRSIYEKELMVVVLAMQKWRHYLLGRHFIIHSNQQNTCLSKGK